MGFWTMTTIKEARQKLGLTQKEMAEILGNTQHRISEIERGVDGRSETKQQLRHLNAIELIFEHALIAELIARCKEN
jgi:transcriptional regulator with XRE-family HTH domain